MIELDAESMIDQVSRLGLVSREYLREAREEAEDGSPDAVMRTLLRKGRLTSWQIDRLKKGDVTGFFFGEAKVLFHLAEGTFARVYRGEHAGSGQPLAVKVLRQRFVQIPEAVKRFHQEAEAGMRIKHPNIVQINDVGNHDNRHYMIMEYVEGMNLRELLRLRGRMSGTDALPLMLGLAEGLKFSHEQGVTHRDIKGTNILISNSGVAKLVDFGLATIEGDQNKPGVKSQRTVDYSALERTCRSPKGDPRSDIYFLGCVFYLMVTGQLPMEEAESKDMLKKMLVRSFGAIKPIAEHPYAPAPELCAIIDRMMKVELKPRYQSMSDVVDDLDKYRRSLESGGQKPQRNDRDDIFDQIFAYPSPPVETPVANSPASGSIEPEEEAVSESGERDQLFKQVFTDPSEAPPNGAVPTSPVSKGPALKTILCVESQDEIQDGLRKTLTKMGYRALVIRNAEIAAERYREAPTDAVLFDLDGQGEEGIDHLIDMHDRAQEDEANLAALVLLGPRQGHLRDRIPEGEEIVVLSKPLKMKEVQDAIRRIVPTN